VTSFVVTGHSCPLTTVEDCKQRLQRKRASEISEFFDVVPLFRSLFVLAFAYDDVGETCSYLQLFKYLIFKIINENLNLFIFLF